MLDFISNAFLDSMRPAEKPRRPSANDPSIIHICAYLAGRHRSLGRDRSVRLQCVEEALLRRGLTRSPDQVEAIEANLETAGHKGELFLGETGLSRRYHPSAILAALDLGTSDLFRVIARVIGLGREFTAEALLRACAAPNDARTLLEACETPAGLTAGEMEETLHATCCSIRSGYVLLHEGGRWRLMRVTGA